MQILDLTHIKWNKNITSYSSGGAYLKASIDGRFLFDDKGNCTAFSAKHNWDDNPNVNTNRKYFLKLSNYDDEYGFIGSESVYEFIASKFGQLLGLDVLDCFLIKARIEYNNCEHIVYVHAAQDFAASDVTKTIFERLYVLEKTPGETRLAFLQRIGFEDCANEMLLFDYLIYNRDRHCNNLEFLKNGVIQLAPLFDNGISFFAPYAGKRREIEAFDVLSNKITNNDFGSRYLENNLQLITNTAIRIPKFNEADLRNELFSKLDEDALPAWHRNKVLELLLKRMQHANKILNNR
ncbi:MAG: hypothetical protein LBG97_02685 [Coriobacteriales bacterium]|jgi:hypothetical protein|nr:hypothetical protein [Coriobacteriales bacterium]